MKRCLNFLFLGLPIFSFSQIGHYIDPEKLSINDYKGAYDPIIKHTAATYSTFKCKYDSVGDKIYNIEVWPEFYPDLSWINWKAYSGSGEVYKDYLFNHE